MSVRAYRRSPLLTPVQAVDEPGFCPLYADVCKRMSTLEIQFPPPEGDPDTKPIVRNVAVAVAAIMRGCVIYCCLLVMQYWTHSHIPSDMFILLPLYFRALRTHIHIYPRTHTYSRTHIQTFKRLLLNRCQQVFESKAKTVDGDGAAQVCVVFEIGRASCRERV